MFITYDDEYYYPLIFSHEHSEIAQVKKFYDYYGWRSYKDPNGGEHFIMMIEDIRSSESDPYWYWVDNFIQISERVVFPDDQYVETWELDPYGNIRFTITNGAKYSVDHTTRKISPGWSDLPTSNNFSFVRLFDDTDAEAIVGKNEK